MRIKYLAQLFLAGALMPMPALAKSGDIVTRGRISSISASTVRVSSKVYRFNNRTKYEDLNGNRISRRRFQAGDIVKVKGPRVDGSLIAREMELERDLVSSSKKMVVEARRGADDGPNHDVGDDHGGNSGRDDSSGRNSSDDSSRNSSDDSRSRGERESSPKRKSNVKLRARLGDAPGVITAAYGKVDREVKQNKGKSEDRLTTKVEIPVPSTTPLLTAESEAPNLAISVAFARSGVQFANCSLAFDHIDDDDNDDSLVKAEYKLDLRSRTRRGSTVMRSKKGDCDIDLATSGIQSGIPDIKVGDTVLVTATNSSSAVEFLTGALKKKR